MKWQNELADAYAVIERASDTVAWVKLRPDVRDDMATMIDSTGLWGARVEIVEAQEEPFLLMGTNPPSVATEQAEWLKASLALVLENRGTVSQVVIEGTHEDGTAFRLVGDWTPK